MGLEPCPRIKAGDSRPSQGVCVWGLGEWRLEGTFSGCAGPQLACLCGHHVQKRRVGAPWRAAAVGAGARSGSPGYRACVHVRFWVGGGPGATLLHRVSM